MLYPQLLERDFERLPRALREFHSAPGGGRARGTVAVRHSNRWLARLTGFPRSGEAIPLEVQVIARDHEELWVRRFGQSVLRSVQRRDGHLLLETVGLLRLHFRVSADHSGMRFESQRARFGMIPLPLRVKAEALGGDSCWNIRVTVAGIGSYSGAVVPQS